jgi:hypothetical protein
MTKNGRLQTMKEGDVLLECNVGYALNSETNENVYFIKIRGHDAMEYVYELMEEECHHMIRDLEHDGWFHIPMNTVEEAQEVAKASASFLLRKYPGMQLDNVTKH